MPEIYHAFDTENLSVFAVKIETKLHSIPRLQLLAYHRKSDRPMLVANMLLMGQWVDWIEVSTEYRRRGFGTELIKGAEAEFGALDMSPGSTDGQAFLDAVCPEA